MKNLDKPPFPLVPAELTLGSDVIFTPRSFASIIKQSKKSIPDPDLIQQQRASIFVLAYMVVTPTRDSINVMFRAFSDRTRLRLLNMLRGGETCVCDLVEVLDVPQPKVSRHLAYLRKAGLVVARKDGLWIHYSLAPAKSEFHKSLLNCLTCCFQSVSELKKDSERLGRSRSGGACSADCCG